MVLPANPVLVPVPARAVDSPSGHPLGPVLLVDDDEAVRNVARGMLERLGCQVLTASGGIEALERQAAEHGRIRLVLADFSMPGMDGVEVLRELRRRDPEVQVVLMSGCVGPDFDELFEPGELAGFLQKPFSLVSLGEVVLAATSGLAREPRGTGLPST